MGYLLPAQYEAYGLEAETADELVTMASALIEAYCRRPSLMATEYTERVRLIAGSQTIRLSYGPLLDGAMVSGRVRYARPRRGEDVGIHPDRNGIFIQEIATAFGLPGTWAADLIADTTRSECQSIMHGVTVPTTDTISGRYRAASERVD